LQGGRRLNGQIIRKKRKCFFLFVSRHLSDFKEKNTTQNIGFHPLFSRHAKDQTSLALVIWLNENVPFLPFVSEFFRYK